MKGRQSRQGRAFVGETRGGGGRAGWGRAGCLDSERGRQSSLVSRPGSHLARSNNEAYMPEKIPICKTSVAESRPADAMSAFMWFLLKEKERGEKREDNRKKEKR